MRLYLSRICLNPLHAPALKLAASPEQLHRTLYALVPETSSQIERPLLFRVDTGEQGPVVLIQSAVPLAWDALEIAPRSLLQPPETKEFDCHPLAGQRMSFRLFTRPSVRKSGDFGAKPNGKRKPGPRSDCRDDEQRLEWLRRKGRESGFVVETVGLSLVSLPAIKAERAGPDRISFTAVRFDGVLVVSDPEMLKEAVRKGIGTQKAFGFGLLSLAALRD